MQILKDNAVEVKDKYKIISSGITIISQTGGREIAKVIEADWDGKPRRIYEGVRLLRRIKLLVDAVTEWSN